jgi:hypothetical protein
MSGNGGWVLVAGDRVTRTEDDFFALKIDRRFAGGSGLSGTYNYNTGERSPFGVFGDLGAQGSASTRHIFGARHTWVVSSGALNDLHFGSSFTRPQGDIPLSKRDFQGGLLTCRVCVGKLFGQEPILFDWPFSEGSPFGTLALKPEFSVIALAMARLRGVVRDLSDALLGARAHVFDAVHLLCDSPHGRLTPAAGHPLDLQRHPGHVGLLSRRLSFRIRPGPARQCDDRHQAGGSQYRAHTPASF